MVGGPAGGVTLRFVVAGLVALIRIESLAGVALQMGRLGEQHGLVQRRDVEPIDKAVVDPETECGQAPEGLLAAEDLRPFEGPE